MIETGAVALQAACDGDLITPEVLALLHDRPLLPIHPLPSTRPTISSTAPLLLARPTYASPAIRAQARTWLTGRLGIYRASDPAEESMLHAVETSVLVRPPAYRIAEQLDADLVQMYLWLCRHWIALAHETADRRYLNAALKLLGVCLIAPGPATELAAQALTEALEALGGIVPPMLGKAGDDLPVLSPIPTTAARDRARVVVLAGAGSRGLPQFLASARSSGVPIAGVLHYDPGPSRTPESSIYASAWYPTPRHKARPRLTLAAPHTLVGTAPHRHIDHRAWLDAASTLEQWECDLLVLVGMDVVPRTVLTVPRLGTINAHNGALPAYRGMDAVAWAMLAGDPVVCSVHEVTEQVDAGAVIAQRAVPTEPADLRQAVKDTQIALLTEVCAAVTATGTMPTSRPQTSRGRRYYRMHPSLRRHLDTVPGPIGAAS